MAFTVHAVMPGVWHIVDCMGVCMTLLEGENAAMLVDTGYGIEDVADFMRHMTDLPLTVFLTHNHHDHAMGARCFPETYMLEADMADWRMFTDDKMRRRVLTQAIGKNLPVDEKTFLAGEIPLPKVMKPGVIDLGGLTAQIIEAPGHTPGSAVVYVPERKLLLILLLQCQPHATCADAERGVVVELRLTIRRYADGILFHGIFSPYSPDFAQSNTST